MNDIMHGMQQIIRQIQGVMDDICLIGHHIHQINLMHDLQMM
jgi:hypothetical protein